MTSAVGEYDRSGDWSIDGFLSAASAIAATCRVDPGVARHYVELARTLSRLSKVADAYAAGDISLRHVNVFADAYSNKRAEALAAAEPILVDAAAEQTPKELAATVRYATDAIDGDGGADSDADEFNARQLFLSKTFGGRGDLRGNCDPVSFDIIEAALEAEMARDHQASDERSADCQAHHKWHWTRGGPTNLDNLELLCWYHHRQRHIDDATTGASLPGRPTGTEDGIPPPGLPGP